LYTALFICIFGTQQLWSSSGSKLSYRTYGSYDQNTGSN